MRRALGILFVLTLGLVTALVVRIRSQEASHEGPPGGSGIIEGTSVDHGSRLGGRVARVAVAAGDAVRVGDLLAELDCAEPQARLAEADARLLGAEAQRETARAQVEIATRARGAASAVAAAAATNVDVAETAASAAAREAARAEAMGEYVSAQRRAVLADGAENGVHARAAARAGTRASQAQARVAGAQVAAAEAAVRGAETAIEAVRALREVARLAVGECQVRATRAGRVEDVFFDAGELVAPGASLVRIVDLAEVTATFYLPNAELAAFTAGGGARVVADAWPGRTFAGRVATVATAAEFTPRTIQTRSDRDRLVYPVEIRLANPDGALRPGMPVQVTLEVP